METRSIEVLRTARYYVEGDLGPETEEVWYLMHGYGERARDFLDTCEMLRAPGRALVAPEGLSRFYRRRGNGDVGASWMTKEARGEEIEDYVRYLDRVRSEVAGEAPGVSRQGLLGFSQGAATACRWAMLGDEPVDRLVLWGGGVPPDADLVQGKDRLAPLSLTFVLGRADSYIQPKDQEREEERLGRASIAFRTVWFDGGHAIDGEVLRDVARR